MAVYYIMLWGWERHQFSIYQKEHILSCLKCYGINADLLMTGTLLAVVYENQYPKSYRCEVTTIYLYEVI